MELGCNYFYHSQVINLLPGVNTKKKRENFTANRIGKHKYPHEYILLNARIYKLIDSLQRGFFKAYRCKEDILLF